MSNKLKPIPCDIYTCEITETIGNVKIEKIAISKRKKKNDIMDAIYEGDFCDEKTIVIFKKQYDEILAPLFREISRLNTEIETLNNN